MLCLFQVKTYSAVGLLANKEILDFYQKKFIHVNGNIGKYTH